MDMDTRVGCYGWIERDGKVLLTYYTLPADRFGVVNQGWTLPGGGMEVGESPEDTVVREVAEETGYVARPADLLGVDNHYIAPAERFAPEGDRPLHALRLIYRAEITGGSFAVEESGTTKDAAWFTRSDVADLRRVSLVDVALRLATSSVRQDARTPT